MKGSVLLDEYERVRALYVMNVITRRLCAIPEIRRQLEHRKSRDRLEAHGWPRSKCVAKGCRVSHHCMDSPSTPTAEARPRLYDPTDNPSIASSITDYFSIASSITDEFSDAVSYMDNASFASSQTSITSYKTDRTVNSRKSRYNALPRRKYAGIIHSTLPKGFVSSDVQVDGASVLEVCNHQVSGLPQTAILMI